MDSTSNEQQLHQSIMQMVEHTQHHQASIAADRTYASEVHAAMSNDSNGGGSEENKIYIPANLPVQRCDEFLQTQNLTVPYYVAPTYQTYVPPGGSLITHMPPQIKRMKKRGCCC